MVARALAVELFFFLNLFISPTDRLLRGSLQRACFLSRRPLISERVVVSDVISKCSGSSLVEERVVVGSVLRVLQVLKSCNYIFGIGLPDFIETDRLFSFLVEKAFHLVGFGHRRFHNCAWLEYQRTGWARF